MGSARCVLSIVALPAVIGCGSAETHPKDEAPGLPAGATELAAEAQRSGDAEAGYRALVNAGYVTCGIPLGAYEVAVGLDPPPDDQVEGREGTNARLPYDSTAVTTASGVTIVSTNCLTCHASRLNGELVVGLGSNFADFTRDTAAALPAARALVKGPEELAELDKFIGRVTAVAPFVKTATIGANTADNIAPVLFAHRDQKTLEWHDDPLLPLPPDRGVPLDVPPWWRMQKKSTMFYTGSGRGDHARIMMSASSFCVDDVDSARAIDAYFPDIYAYLQTIEPPRYPYAVDDALAAKGKDVFEETCSRCHGTYGKDATYPNLVIDVATVGTDPLLADAFSQRVGEYVDWFNGSFWGEVSRLEPNDGYVAPPLDGIWATAPYLHNGSVPTIAELLESKKRPAYWTRDRSDSSSYDQDALGFTYQALDAGQDAASDSERPAIYDTTLEGYGNQGHTFGDGLSAEDRAAVLEYLKTL